MPYGSLPGEVLLDVATAAPRALGQRCARQQSAGKQIGPTGARPRDFPQAFTHLALSGAAGNLDRQRG
jgi:hypothetical protein